MKRSILIMAIALMVSAGLLAQETTQVQEQKKEQKKEHKEMVKKQKKANHGQEVSQTARSTQSGPGKGEVVSAQAKNKGETQQVEVTERTVAKNKDANKGARPEPTQQTRVKTAGGAKSGRR